MIRWYTLLLSGIFCISTSAILVTLSEVPPTVSAFYRNFLAAIMLLFLYPATRPFHRALRKTEQTAADHKNKFLLAGLMQRSSVSFLLFLLGLFFAIDLWAWHRSIFLLGAGPATLMGNLQVLIVSVLAFFFFAERLEKWFWPGSLLALSGIGLLTLTRGIGQEVAVGVLYGLLTAFTYSFFLIILRYLDRFHTTPGQVLFWVAAVTSFFLFFPLIVENTLYIPAGSSLAWLALHAFLSSVVGWWMIISALPHLPLAVSSTLLLLQPVLTSIWGHIFLKQVLSPIQIVGIVLALAGIRLATLQSSSR